MFFKSGRQSPSWLLGPALLLLASPSAAGLSFETVISPGNATKDDEAPVAGDVLYWLDPILTTNLSWIDLCDGAGPGDDIGWVKQATGIGDDWRHATGAEVCDLFAKLNAAGVPSPCPGDPIELAGHAVANHYIWLGTTLDSGGNTEVAGLYGGSMTAGQCDPNQKLGLAIAHHSSNLGNSNVMVKDGYAPARIPGDGVGHFLVTVPEPGQVLILATGALFLAGLRWALGLRLG